MNTYTTHKYLGSEIRVSRKTDRFGDYWATAFSGMIAENSKTKSGALSKAKKKIKSAVSKIKSRR